MSDNQKEAEENMAKAIFISADCWLCVFDLLEPSQLGLGIALISHRFDFYVDEHFKTRKRALKCIHFATKIGKNGTKKMEIVNCEGKSLPIPKIQMPMPRKVIGFKQITIHFIDQNSIAFLRRFRQLFVSSPLNLTIYTDKDSDCILELILNNIWPMIGKNICGMKMFPNVFQSLRKLVPSFLSECPSLHYANFNYDNLFAEFPADDTATASDGQWVAKWLFAPHPNNVPKVFPCWLEMDAGLFASKLEAFKTAFANASSPANFIVIIWVLPSFADSVVPFNRTNELTREQFALKRTDHYSNRFLLIRCPIARDESKWTKWEEEAIGWRIYDQRNRINIRIDNEGDIGDGLLDATPSPSDQQQK